MNRRFDSHLIPPGINDARIRWLWGAFGAALAEIDLSPHSLCMRTSAEMTVEMLPLAVWELSLEEFMPPEGLPEHVVRRLIDRACELHALKGTDEGVQLGLQLLLGGRAEIVHWWQREPRGHHDTHTITVWNSEAWGGDVIMARQQLRATWRMIDATKRWSQETWLRIGIEAPAPLHIAAAQHAGAVIEVYPPIEREVVADAPLRLAAAQQATAVITVWPPLGGQAQASGSAHVGGAAT